MVACVGANSCEGRSNETSTSLRSVGVLRSPSLRSITLSESLRSANMHDAQGWDSGAGPMIGSAHQI